MEQSLGIPCCLSLATSTMVVVSLMTTTGSQIHRHQWFSLSMLFFFWGGGDFKGGTCHCWKVIFFYIWKWKMEKGGMAMLLSWILFHRWIYMSPCALIGVSISAQPQVFTVIYNWCQEKLTLPSGTCPFLRLQFCLEEMPLGHPGEVRHSQNPWTWLQVLWEWYLQALHGRWIAREPIDLGNLKPQNRVWVYGRHIFWCCWALLQVSW